MKINNVHVKVQNNFYIPFGKQESDTKGHEVTCPKSHDSRVSDPRTNSGPPNAESTLFLSVMLSVPLMLLNVLVYQEKNI